MNNELSELNENELVKNFKMILDVSPRMIFVCKKENQEILYVNKSFSDYVHLSQNQCIGAKCNNVLCGQKKWEIENCFCISLDNKEEVKTYYNKDDDCYFDIESREIKWMQYDAYVFFFEEVSEREKKQKSDLQQERNQYQSAIQREKRFKDTIEFANMLIWDYDPKKRCFYNDNGWLKEYELGDIVYNVPESLFEAGVIDDKSKDSYAKVFNDIHEGKDKPSCEVWIYFQTTGEKNVLGLHISWKKMLMEP